MINMRLIQWIPKYMIYEQKINTNVYEWCNDVCIVKLFIKQHWQSIHTLVYASDGLNIRTNILFIYAQR